MRRSRRLLPLLFATALFAAACGGSDSGDDPDAGTSPAAAGEQTTEGGGSTGGSGAADGTDAAGGGSEGGEGSTAGGEGTAAGSGGAPSGGTLTIGLANDPGNLDPSMTILSTTRSISHLAYDTLVSQNLDGEFVSGVASEWEVKPTSVTFTIDPDVTCSDGSPFTASDAKANIDYVADPKNSSPLLGVLLPPGVTTEADDEAGTLTVTAPEPNAFLINGISGVFMVCKAGLADHDKLAQKTIGTGPFVLEEAVADDHYTYSVRPEYSWGPDGTTMQGPGVPDEVNVRVISNPTTLANLLLAGEVNVGAVIGADSNRLDEAGLDRVDAKAPLGELFFNQDEGRPGADPKVREALVTALNMEALTKIGAAGNGTPSTGMVTIEPEPCSGDTVSGNLPAFDAATAAQILDEAGWAPGPDGIRAKDGAKLEIRFIYPASGGDSMAAAAELLSQMWKQIGVSTKLQAVTSNQLNEVAFGTGAWDAGWIPVTVNLPSQLVPFLSGPVPPEGTNIAHLSNETYEQDSAKALGTGEVEAACELWTSAETALITNLDVVPMFDTNNGTYMNGATVTMTAGELDAASLRLTS